MCRKDALRSIIVSQRLLGTREIAVIHHTACGMTTFQTEELRARVKAADPANAALYDVDAIDFLEFADLEKSVRDDVGWLREHPLVLPESQITGWVYEVETGKVSAGGLLNGRVGADGGMRIGSPGGLSVRQHGAQDLCYQPLVREKMEPYMMCMMEV